MKRERRSKGGVLKVLVTYSSKVEKADPLFEDGTGTHEWGPRNRSNGVIPSMSNFPIELIIAVPTFCRRN